MLFLFYHLQGMNTGSELFHIPFEPVHSLFFRLQHPFEFHEELILLPKFPQFEEKLFVTLPAQGYRVPCLSCPNSPSRYPLRLSLSHRRRTTQALHFGEEEKGPCPFFYPCKTAFGKVALDRLGRDLKKVSCGLDGNLRSCHLSLHSWSLQVGTNYDRLFPVYKAENRYKIVSGS